MLHIANITNVACACVHVPFNCFISVGILVLNWFEFVRYFGENGWPSSKISETPPSSDSDKENLVDIIQVCFLMSFGSWIQIILFLVEVLIFRAMSNIRLFGR
jgi:hypothetical protein